MSKISATKKLILEDFSEQRSWIEKLVSPINAFFEQVYFALVNGLTFADNIKSQRFDYTLRAGQDYTKPITFSWTLNERPTAVILAYIAQKVAEPGVIGAHNIQWAFDNGALKVWFVGLSNSIDYTITIVGIV